MDNNQLYVDIMPFLVPKYEIRNQINGQLPGAHCAPYISWEIFPKTENRKPALYFFPPFFLGVAGLAAFLSSRFCFWAASSTTFSRFTATRFASFRQA